MDLAQIKEHLNSEPVKYGILFLSSPIWLPFVKALWRALNDALRDEGGILGTTPTAAELRALERERGAHVSPLVSVTWREHETGADLRNARRGASTAPGSAAPAVRPRGFRSTR